MRMRSLCLLLLLALVALPAWSAAPAMSPATAPAAPQVTLADILAPAPAQLAPAELDFSSPMNGAQEMAGCFPTCTSNGTCQTLCCATATCRFVAACNKSVCNCSVCP
jgi:hypothetical protein